MAISVLTLQEQLTSTENRIAFARQHYNDEVMKYNQLQATQQFDCATWVHRARELPKEEFKHEVTKHLTGKDEERSELLYFKVYKSQLAVIEQALETATLMLGGDKSRGYCLEMICADFLAGASLEADDENKLLFALTRLIDSLAPEQKCRLLEMVGDSVGRIPEKAAAATA